MKKILIPVDGSEHSDRALEEGKKLAQAFSGEIIILNVVKGFKDHHIHEGLDVYQLSKDFFEEESNKIINHSKEKLKEFDGVVKTFIVEGEPPEEIINLAEKEDVSLIVMGSRGLSGFNKLIIGSVTSNVLNHCKRPVMVIK